MHCPDRRARPAHSSGDLHQATRIVGNDIIDTAGLYAIQLLLEDRIGNLAVLHRESSPETTTRIGRFHFDKINLAHRAEQPPRLIGNSELAQEMTGIVISHSSREARAHVFDA